MSCECDHPVFPLPLKIAAGLQHLPRQIATFPEWRNALLAELGRHPPLHEWRAREPGDFGVMLLEMWAYVCDSVAFLDETIAHECYPRTARLRPSLRKLVDLLGYLPCPAIGATATLAAVADGRKAVVLPPRTAFRSGEFDGHPPQLFELSAPARIHPFHNQWPFKPVVPTTVGGTGSVSQLLLRPGSVKARAGDWLLLSTGSSRAVARATSLSPYTGSDGTAYVRLMLDAPIATTSATALSALDPMVPTGALRLWQRGGTVLSGSTLYLDGVYAQLHKDAFILLRRGTDVRWFQIAQTAVEQRTLMAALTSTLKDTGGTVTGTVVSPPIDTLITKVTLDAAINTRKRSAGFADWADSDAPDVVLQFGLTAAGIAVAEPRETLSKTDSLQVGGARLDAGFAPAAFLLEDENEKGVAATGTLNLASGAFAVDGTANWPQPLARKAQLYGNVLMATRGESVLGEQLGVGNASLLRQVFQLASKPLTYLPSPTVGNDQGVASTLEVYVGGVRWQEVRSFFGQPAGAEIYIVRQDDEENSQVIFGGGARLPTGAPVIANYRFGAGAASPPAGSVVQLAKAVPGLRGVRHPVAAFGGADREPASQLATMAPKSALLLGRAVSLADMTAAASTVGGVRAVAATWAWNEGRQQPVAQLHYVGPSGLEPVVTQRLLNLTDPNMPIDVAPAVSVPSTLAIEIEIDPRYLLADLRKQVRALLATAPDGLLSPERVGIGVPLFRSRIFEAVLSVPGAVAVRGLSLNGAPFADYGVNPGAGHYFDFEAGALILNGAANDA